MELNLKKHTLNLKKPTLNLVKNPVTPPYKMQNGQYVRRALAKDQALTNKMA